MRRRAPPLATLDWPACSSCGQNERACELFSGMDRVCCTRCSHPRVRAFWRTELLRVLTLRSLRVGLDQLEALHSELAFHGPCDGCGCSRARCESGANKCCPDCRHDLAELVGDALTWFRKAVVP